MDIFPLAIFPQGSLASSVIPAVWVGVFVVCFFNMRLGWVLTGLVVPGYLVPLLLIKPWAAAVVFLEGFTTYFLIWLFSEYGSKRGPWSNLFGRDRFLALLLCSILVRLLFDGFLLPAIGAWANDYWQINFDYRNQLHSFGLIIVALIANQMWKSGFVKGFFPLTVTIGLTLLIVRFGLMEFTNFSLSSIGYIYEDMAASILASPKAYIILVTTAFLASRMNLHYGWDFNGILIPSLLALQWFQPVKILATLFEAGIILLLATWLLKTPWMRSSSVEGAKKMLLFFNVSFAYKLITGYIILIWFPAIKVTDYFGFGYLLSTLMALKIHDKAIFGRLLRATMQTSMTAVAMASVIGFSLTLLPFSTWLIGSSSEAAVISELRLNKVDKNLSELLKEEQVRLYEVKANNSFVVPQAADVENFSFAIQLLKDYLREPNEVLLARATNALSMTNYQLELVKNRYLYMTEKGPLNGWGVYVIDTQSTSNLSLSVPSPLDEESVLDAGIALFTSMDALSLAISGSSRFSRADIGASVLQNRQTFFHIFHRLFNRDDSLQIRTYAADTARQISGLRSSGADIGVKGLASTLWVKQQFPESLNLVTLKKLMDQFQVVWRDPPFINVQRDSSSGGFAELILSRKDVRKLLFRHAFLNVDVGVLEQDLSLEGYLQDWILSKKELIAARGSELYQPPSQEEMLFFDEQILTPLMAVDTQYEEEGAVWTEENLNSLRIISRAAKVLGYQLIRYSHQKSGQNYLILSEDDQSGPSRYWGMYIFRLGESDPYLVQVSRPSYESNSFEYGVVLYERLKAKYLMIGTAHPFANRDGSANVIKSANMVSLFNLFNQVMLRESIDKPMMVVNLRAFSKSPDRPTPETDALLSVVEGRTQRQYLGLIEQRLISTIEADDLTIKLANGSLDTQGYEVGVTAQSLYLNATENKSFAILWLSPEARKSYKLQTENRWQITQFRLLDFSMRDVELFDFIKLSVSAGSVSLHPEIKKLVDHYVVNPDIVRLEQVGLEAAKQGYKIQRLLDVTSKQAFMAISSSDGLIAITNLSARSALERELSLSDVRAAEKQLDSYISRRERWLWIR